MTREPLATGPRVAVVSGGSRGLGARIVQHLLDDDWCVSTMSRSRTAFIDEAATDHPDTFHWRSVDLAEPAALRDYAREAESTFGRVDLLVNNAAVLDQQLFLTTAHKEIDRLLAIDLLGPIVLTQACARAMTRGGGGHIINISSINAVRGFRGVAVYSAAKAGLHGFSRSIAQELGPLGVRVNTVVPGYFDSDMTSNVTDDNRVRISRRTPLGRLGTVDEMLAAVAFLISEGASFMTGQTITIDGGLTC